MILLLKSVYRMQEFYQNIIDQDGKTRDLCTISNRPIYLNTRTRGMSDTMSSFHQFLINRNIL